MKTFHETIKSMMLQAQFSAEGKGAPFVEECAMSQAELMNELQGELKAMKISIDRALGYIAKLQYAPPQLTHVSPRENWLSLIDLHETGEWWRCPLAREMLLTVNKEGGQWNGAGMRDPQDSMMWVENMAIGDTDESTLPHGAVNFWSTARMRFNSWKRKHGLL